jgi:hypothetical protein
VFVLVFIFKFLFPYTLSFFSTLELYFVNTLGMPFNSGSIIAGIILVATFYFGIKYTHKKKLIGVNLIILCLLFIMIGFSSWTMLPIRANANTTINENNPSSARELLAYYNREQYGDASIFYDSYYSETGEQNRNNPYRDDKPKYEKDAKLGKYVIVNNYKDALPNYTDKHKGFIPRMVDRSPRVIANYKAIAGISSRSKRRPTFGENLKFMLKYQFGYMYGRYFMWNFVGRQNDVQGQLDTNGNWLSGINFIDEMRLGTQKNLPNEMKNNESRNTYYFLPLLLGIIGLLFHIKFDKKNFYILLLFFVFTGLAIIFYTNPKPFEPRERDYAVVGSFYIFAIWIGIGVLALYEQFKDKLNSQLLAIGITSVCLLAVPVLMASENWDDHDRSNRYSVRNMAKAYLDSCQENAIMFTVGDNDTFPLWYMQEVENYRTDIKLIVTSYFATDWYIDQQKRKTYKADPIPSQLTHKQYKTGSLDVAYHVPNPSLKDSIIDIKTFMNWIASNDERTLLDLFEDGIPEKYYPTNKIWISVDKEAVLKNKIVPLRDADKIVPYIDIEIDESYLGKHRILMLDLLANNNWERPIYFSGGSLDDGEYIWLKDYLQLDGLAYKFVPIKTSNSNKDGRRRSFIDLGRIDTETMYTNVKKWDWKNSNLTEVFIDSQTQRNSISMRMNLMRLAEEFVKEEKNKKAEEILDLSFDKMPIKRYGYYNLSLGFVDNYYKLNKKGKARNAAKILVDIFQDRIQYYGRLDSYNAIKYSDDIDATFIMFNNVVATVNQYDKVFADNLEGKFRVSFDLIKHHIDI